MEPSQAHDQYIVWELIKVERVQKKKEAEGRSFEQRKVDQARKNYLEWDWYALGEAKKAKEEKDGQKWDWESQWFSLLWGESIYSRDPQTWRTRNETKGLIRNC